MLDKEDRKAIVAAHMKFSAFFRFAVRLTGIFLLYKTVFALTGYFTIASDAGPMHGMSRPALLHVFFLGAAAAWFLHGAPPIEDWAYPNSAPDDWWKTEAPPKTPEK